MNEAGESKRLLLLRAADWAVVGEVPLALGPRHMRLAGPAAARQLAALAAAAAAAAAAAGAQEEGEQKEGEQKEGEQEAVAGEPGLSLASAGSEDGDGGGGEFGWVGGWVAGPGEIG